MDIHMPSKAYEYMMVYVPTKGENQLLDTDELFEFEKQPVEV
jgi:hypothetical protein